MYFPLGLGVFLSLTYVCAIFTTGPILLYSVWIGLLILSWFEAPVLTYRFRRTYLWGAPFVLLGFWSTFTPVTFFDSMVYYLGLPYQYVSNGVVGALPFNMYTAFPPFNQVLNLLFVGIGFDSGINVFSIILYFQIIAILLGLLRLLSTESSLISRGNGRDSIRTDRI